MTTPIQGLGRLRPISSFDACQPIWISNALLAESFHRFCVIPRRHGSHIPGPLEARRRASKRRNTSLAYAQTTSLPVDPGVLFGLGQQPGWWTDTGSGPCKDRPDAKASLLDVSRSSKVHGLPHWPAPWLVPAAPTPLNSNLDPTREFVEDDIEKDLKLAEFRSLIQAVKTPEQLRQAIKQLDIDFIHEPRCSELVLDHLLDPETSPDLVIQFLLDPTLNRPGASNYARLLEKLKERAHGSVLVEGILSTIPQAVYLGLMSTEQIRIAFEILSDIKVCSEERILDLKATPVLNKLCSDVLQALITSTIIDAKDLGKEFFRKIMVQMSTCPFSMIKGKLWWDLRHYVDRSSVEVANKICLSWLPRIQDGGIKEMANFLQMLPYPVLAHSIYMITTKLALTSKKDAAGLTTLKSWHSILQKINYPTVRGIIHCLSLEKDAVIGYDQELTSQERLLILSWISSALCRGHSQSPRLLQSLNLQADFLVCFGPSNNSGVDTLDRVLYSLKELPLPQKTLVLRSLPDLSGNLLRVAGKTDVVTDHLMAFTGNALHELLDDHLYQLVKKNCPNRLSELASSINYDLNRFLHLAERLLATDKSACKIIYRVLRHNIPFQRAVSETGTQFVHPSTSSKGDKNHGKPLLIQDECGTQGDSDRLLSSSPVPGLGESQDLPATRVSPVQAIHVINRLALLVATSPVLPKRSAYKKVYWFYQFLREHGGYLGAAISRAFWHAGVTRYHGRGQTPTRLNWILSKVREIEGPEVVRLLLHSARFRESRESEMPTPQNDYRSPTDLETGQMRHSPSSPSNPPNLIPVL